MAWQNLDEDLAELFTDDAEYRADAALEKWAARALDRRAVYQQEYTKRPHRKREVKAYRALPERKRQVREYQRGYSKTPQRVAYMAGDKMLTYMREYQRAHRQDPAVLEAKRAYQREYNKRKRLERKATNEHQQANSRREKGTAHQPHGAHALCVAART